MHTCLATSSTVAWLAGATVALAQAPERAPLDLSLPKIIEGEIRSVREVRLRPALEGPPAMSGQRPGTAAAIDSALPVGAVLYLPMTEEPERWRFGAAAPATAPSAGQSPENNVAYGITVLMDDGRERNLVQRERRGLHAGQRVLVDRGEIEPQ